MASIKINGTLESADLLGFPLTLTLTQSFGGIGKGKAFQKFDTTTKSGNPILLPGSAFSSTDKKVYIYIKNTSKDAAESINIYIKNTVLKATLTALECCEDCLEDLVFYTRIAMIGAGEYLFIPLADQDSLYADATSGTPTLDYLILEN